MSETKAAPTFWIGLSSAGICTFIIWWVYLRTGASNPTSAPWAAHLAAFNACFNALSAFCVIAGWRAIRRGDRQRHMRWMVIAVCFTVLFLCSYLTYHHYHGDTRFTGTGAIRPIYFGILISHIVLSIVVAPLLLTTLYHAARRGFARHRRVARVTLPIWLVVSVTGVLVFLFQRMV